MLTHEFGNYIQFQLSIFGDEVSPEATRRTELMAGAYAAYYLPYARGSSYAMEKSKTIPCFIFNAGGFRFY